MSVFGCQKVVGPYWLQLVGKKNTVNVVYQLCGLLPTFFKIASFVFSRRKNFLQVWNNLRVC